MYTSTARELTPTRSEPPRQLAVRAPSIYLNITARRLHHHHPDLKHKVPPEVATDDRRDAVDGQSIRQRKEADQRHKNNIARITYSDHLLRRNDDRREERRHDNRDHHHDDSSESSSAGQHRQRQPDNAIHRQPDFLSKAKSFL